MVDYVIACIISFLIGIALRFRDKEEEEEIQMYQSRLKEYEAELVYYKKLTKTLVDENLEFRRKNQ
jgi:hypothetical protein